MSNLEKKVQNEIWKAYKGNQKQSLKKLARRLSKKFHVKDEDVYEYILEEKQRSKRKTRLGMLALGLGGLLSLWLLKPESKIFTSDVENLLHDKGLYSALSKELKKEHAKRICVKSFEGRSYIELEDKVNLSKFESIANEVNKEFKVLGLNSGYHVKLLKYKWQLWFTEHKRIWLVKNTGVEARAELAMTLHNGTVKTGCCSFVYDGSGTVGVKCLFGKDRIKLYRGPIFVRTRAKDRVDIYSAMFCEPLHDQLISYKEMNMQYLTRTERKGKNIVYVGAENAKFAARATDEGIVHGICQSWLEENLERFGFSRTDLEEDFQEKEGLLAYKGVKIIRGFARDLGRKKLLEDYMKNPLKYWKILQERIPEYRHLQG